MKLLGCEVRSYAGLRAQYIPLDPGVHLLVGKNNVGKSALLHAVNFSSTAASTYSDNDSLICLICALDDNEKSFIEGPEAPYYHNAESWIRMEFFSTQAGKNFRRGWLCSPSIKNELEVFTPVPQQIRRTTYAPKGQAIRHDSFQPNYVNVITAPLEQAIYIDPHRIVNPSTPVGEKKSQPTNGGELAGYLQDVQGRPGRLFERVESAFLAMFPEFTAIHTPMSGQAVSLTLEERSGSNRPLAKCGTGLEQILVLLTNVICAPAGRVLLLDEPHNFLFPTVERKFLEILKSISDRTIIIATHSAIMLNGVSPDRVTFIERPGKSYEIQRSQPAGPQMPRVLQELGYRNSDLLFFDALIFVEGQSDTELLLQLLSKAKDNGQFPISNVGCPNLGGTGEYKRPEDIQNDVIVEEKLLRSLGRTSIPHVYLFDGDKAEHAGVLARTRPEGFTISYLFLKRYEIENYFLIPSAIATALNFELASVDSEAQVTEAEIQTEITKWTGIDPTQQLSEQERAKLFPKSLPGPPEKTVKGSRVLEKIYGARNLTYHKERSGKLILENLHLSQEMKDELRQTAEAIVELLAPQKEE